MLLNATSHTCAAIPNQNCQARLASIHSGPCLQKLETLYKPLTVTTEVLELMGTFKSVSTLRADGTGNEEHDSQNQMTEDSAHILHAQLFWTPAQLTHVEYTGSVHTHRSLEVSVTRLEVESYTRAWVSIPNLRWTQSCTHCGAIAQSPLTPIDTWSKAARNPDWYIT